MSPIILKAIEEERQRQDEKWGKQHHDNFFWLAILTEEIGEVAEALLEHNRARLTEETIQVAAVAIAWLEDWEQTLAGK